MIYHIEIYRQAQKTLDYLDKTTLHRINAKILELMKDPYSPRVSRPMQTMPETRYSRVGDWRIIYLVHEEIQTIDIIAVSPRGRAYR